METSVATKSRSSMMSVRNTSLVIVGLCASVIVAYTFNPMVWRVRLLFPSAKVTDLYDDPLVPAFLHSRLKDPNDLYDGKYLAIEISDTTVDLNKLRGIPWCFLRLHRCKISDLSILREMNILETNCDVYFDDCDLSGVPRTQFRRIDPPSEDPHPPDDFYSFPADPKHFTYNKPP
jgi:hypothetical protein